MIVDLVRGKPVEQALEVLSLLPQRAAKDVRKAVKAAAANAENNHDMVVSDLKISEIVVNQGPQAKRFRPRAHGRTSPLLKRMSHITVVVSD